MNDEIEETIDEDMIRMEGLMDEWCLELKRNFLVRKPSSQFYQPHLFLNLILLRLH